LAPKLHRSWVNPRRDSPPLHHISSARRKSNVRCDKYRMSHPPIAVLESPKRKLKTNQELHTVRCLKSSLHRLRVWCPVARHQQRRAPNRPVLPLFILSLPSRLDQADLPSLRKPTTHTHSAVCWSRVLQAQAKAKVTALLHLESSDCTEASKATTNQND
jgi:hypothetical protein